MGELSSLWGFEESVDIVEMEHRLLHTSLELEKLKADSMEETKKNREYIKHLINMLKMAIQERDAARNQLQKLLQITRENLKQGNSGVTESNSISDNHNYHSHGSSPVESLFDPGAAAVLIGDQIYGGDVPKPDHGTMIIENMAKGKVLPQRGKFVEAVLRAGPLLQTLVTAGPLPQWRNPPPQIKAFQIPKVSVKTDAFGQRSLGSGQVNLGKYSYGSAQIQANFKTNSFGHMGYLSNNVSAINGYASLGKKQRFN